ncbi:glycosyltransferase [Eubacterium oxidoreducens]|uniref:Glycosyl transferases group 1 n=1 Tax=Eubacterium oxidoreducens TaxID=1732 RepID=A0A1G6BSH6_EUBOX|nr:glycosyltransferase [Eubacterium oxidoreducens]SDB23581.1 Glycosyl transferases group 1 [Eubacterium oxidoreducens]
MRTHIILIEGIYDTLDTFSEELHKVLIAQGYSCLVYIDGVTPLDTLREYLQTDDAAVITFNNLAYSLENEPGENIWEFYQTPYINILMDHPFHYRSTLNKMPSTAIIVATDKNHADYVRRHFSNIEHVFFLPHGGICPANPTPPIKERQIEVLYAGGLSRFQAESMIPEFDKMPEINFEEVSATVLNTLVTHPSFTLESVLESYFKEQGFNYDDDTLSLRISQLRFLELYATSFFREQALLRIADSGHTVTVYGNGWNRWEGLKHPYINYCGRCSQREILSHMTNSKIVLNTNSWFKAGAHDRIFNGMLAGAVVLTDSSSYLEKQFTREKQLCFFSLENIKSLGIYADRLLNNFALLQEIADNGYQAARNSHTWKSRFEIIKDFL